MRDFLVGTESISINQFNENHPRSHAQVADHGVNNLKIKNSYLVLNNSCHWILWAREDAPLA